MATQNPVHYTCVSSLFRGDSFLNAAANHQNAHIGLNYRNHGAHVQKIKKALIAVDPKNMYDKCFAPNDKYDAVVAVYVSAFKKEHGIFNHAGKIDMICGIKTIRTLDTLCAKTDFEF